jgi:hypothetical protein
MGGKILPQSLQHRFEYLLPHIFELLYALGLILTNCICLPPNLRKEPIECQKCLTGDDYWKMVEQK